MDKRRAPANKNNANSNLLMMSQNKEKQQTIPSQTPGEMDDDHFGMDYMIMEVSDHTKKNLIPNCFGVYRPT